MNTSHLLREARARLLSRRWFFGDCGVGLAGIAASSMLASEGRTAAMPAAGPLAPKASHFAPKAKRVVYMFQAGAPSHLELFDPKPELAKHDGKLPPADLLKGYRAAFINPKSALLGPKYKFQKYGASGIEMSELLPYTGAIADDICLVRSMQTDAVNHAPAQILMNTGSQQFGRPSFGSWTLKGIDRETQRASLDTLNRLNDLSLKAVGDPEIVARIQSYEMAYRLQASAPELLDLASEPKEVLARYGISDPTKAGFARNCLLARRLLERGVRFVQLFHEAWDQHGDLTKSIKKNALDTDQASAALVSDLKERGLLDDTIVVWGGEFGRTPMVQGGNDGRDHHNRAFTTWLAGGGIKGGHVHGQTDDFGFNPVADKVHVHDLNATLLHLLGFDHTKLTYRFQGRDYRLTDVHGNLVKGILA